MAESNGYRLPDTLEELRLKFREFNAKEIVPLEEDLERVPYDADKLGKEDHERLEKKAKAEGLWGPDVPKEYGGLELDSFGLCVISEEVAQHRAGMYAAGYGVYGVTIVALPFVIFGPFNCLI